MKLQKNNKYVKKLTAGLSAAILSASILVGCGASKNTLPTETSIAVETPAATPTILDITNPQYYYKTINEMSEEEYNERMDELNVKYPDALNIMNQVNTIVVRDNNNGEYKIIQTLERWDSNNKIIKFYDLFTEAFLFELPYNDANDFCGIDNLYKNVDISKACNKISYFDDKEIFEYGVCAYSTYFTYYHLDLLKEQTGINYYGLDSKSLTYMYPQSFQNSDLKYTTSEIADNYIKTVPRNLQVNAKNLGVEIIYPEERKYADFWKISNEEREERYNTLEVVNENEKTTLDKVFTLIIKDEKEDLKLLQVKCIPTEDGIEIYNLFTSEYLFTMNESDFNYYENNAIDCSINFNNSPNKTPYFEGKILIKIDGGLGIINYINKLTSNVNYEYPDAGFDYYIIPYGATDTRYVSCTVKELGYNYVITVPENMQVTAEELRVGLIKGNGKSLVK